MVFAPLFGRRGSRHVVATVLVAVDGDAFLPLQRLTLEAAARIVAAPDEFDVASHEVARVARALLDHESHWTAAALGGDVFDDEASAGSQLAEVYADLASRYLAGEHDLARDVGDQTSREQRCVVMLTVAYAGESDDVERELHDRLDVARVLKGIAALHERDALLGAQLHVAPAHPEDRLTDEQVLVGFPELHSI
ncbi:MAG: DUF1517 domain-containing protein [Deltaproteobacteria bacterium]|nr:DUF1517 domain-containing protein [Deltaproteobacteria bacterium]